MIRLTLTTVLATLLVAVSARADEKTACLAATDAGQSLRDAHKLLEAREQFRTCAQETCPAVVRHDCVTWLNSLDAEIPSVVLSFRDGAGADIVDARVTVDGHAFVDGLTGAAVPIDPGAHTFHFERRDGREIDKQVLVGEGQQNLVVAAAFLPPPGPVHSSTRETVGWVVGATGAAGLVVGAVFGGLAAADKGNGGCNASNRCTNWAAISRAKTAADVSDVGLIAGGVLAATGATLVVVSRASSGKTAWIEVAPRVAWGAGGVTLQGAW